jgi:hypothetical protein
MTTAVRTAKPVLGPRARAAMKIDAGGRVESKLLILLAAYADAGEASPTVVELAKRMRLRVKSIDRVLDLLVAARLIEVEWAGGKAPPGKRAGKPGHRNVYRVLLDA